MFRRKIITNYTGLKYINFNWDIKRTTFISNLPASLHASKQKSPQLSLKGFVPKTGTIQMPESLAGIEFQNS